MLAYNKFHNFFRSRLKIPETKDYALRTLSFLRGQHYLTQYKQDVQSWSQFLSERKNTLKMCTHSKDD